MRDRLVELIKKVPYGVSVGAKFEQHFCEKVADHLLASGVIVLPYKPMPLIDEGDRVLCPICETDLMGQYIGYDNEPTVVTCFECGAWIDSTKAVTREEAEKAIAERRNDVNT